MIIADSHVHSTCSFDGSGSVRECCARAAALGLREICFLEHLDLYPPDPWYRHLNDEAYAAAIAEARAELGDRLAIKMGVEVTYLPALEKEIADYVAEKNYDCVAGGVHLIFQGEGGVSDEMEALETFAKHDPAEVFDDYFFHVEAAVRSGLFDVLCHLDLVQRYGSKYIRRFDFGRHYGVLRRILEGVVKRQMALEINSSGLRQGPQAPYPSRELLQLYRELGGELVTVGSDAHCPEHVGGQFEQVGEIIREVRGLKPVAFHQRLLQTI